MAKISRYLGMAGILLVIAGAIGYAIAPMFTGFYLLPWGLASIFLIIYLGYNLTDLRNAVGGRLFRYGAGSAGAVLLVSGILIIIMALSAKHPLTWDLTTDQRHRLAPQTLNILKSLDKDVSATGFFVVDGGSVSPAKELLDRFEKASPKFKYQLVDPDRDPRKAKEAGVTKYGTVAVQAGDKKENIEHLSEERLTNAILRVTKPYKKVIYFLSGHGEKDLNNQDKTGFSQVRTRLEDQNYTVKTLALMQLPAVPADAAVIVVAGPRQELLPSETDAIEAYLRRGGKAMFLLDPQSGRGLDEFLLKFNVALKNDIVVDEESRAYGFDPAVPLIQRYTQHPIIKDFSAFSIFPLARSISVTPQKNDDVSVVPLALTGDHAWAETNLKKLAETGAAEYDPDEDSRGNIPVAVVGTVELKGGKDHQNPPRPEDRTEVENKGKFIVFGDSDFAANGYIDLVGNGDLFLSSLSWLAEEADLVAIRSRETKNQPLMLTAMQGRIILWLPAVAIPLGVLVIGLLVVVARRSRK